MTSRAARAAGLLLSLSLAVGVVASRSGVAAETESPPAGVANLEWAATWGAAEMRQDGATPWTTLRLPRNELTNQTVRLIVRTTAGGSAVRLRLGNDEGTTPVDLNHVSVALRGARASLVWGSVVDATFNGSPHIRLEPQKSVVSDPVVLPVVPGSELAVSMHVMGAHAPFDGHWAAKRTSFVSAPGSGDLTWGLTDAGFEWGITSTVWLRGLDVLADPNLPVVVAIGDSLTDGHFVALPDTNQDWPAVLAGRLDGRASVVNAGINANNLTRAGCAWCGTSVVSRLDRDALAIPSVSHLIVLAGSNDLAAGRPASTVADGMVEVTRRAHDRGVRVIAGTIPPRNDTYNGWSSRNEVERQKFNAWLRSSRAFDGLVDFDRVLRDPDRPSRMLPRFDSGDQLHPSVAGMAAMAGAIDLAFILG